MGPRARQFGAPGRRAAGLAALAGLAILGGLWLSWDRWRAAESGPSPYVPRTPYLNARPGVAYVGDAACTRCHAEIAADFRRHPMGRSLATADQAPQRERGGEDADKSFEAQGLRYTVERRDARLIHKEQRLDAHGRVVAGVEAEVRFVLGSGERGLSYLIDRDGRLFQSPIGWFAQARRWDLSPGYAARNEHFERPIEPDCLFCHANRSVPVEGTINGYREPIFDGMAIGCERCHGPGEKHVRAPGSGDGAFDPTIVNPRHLEPALREAVCEQCHLQGAYHVERAGRRATDYRPGLPLEDFLAVLVPGSRRGGGNPALGHVEQMHASRCYRASRGRLGCIACHDPHRKPAPEEAVAFYRDRCLACHAERGCRLPPTERRERTPEDSCIACHMPRAPLTDIAHTAATDHRIPRREGRNAPPSAGLAPTGGGELPLALYHPDRFDPRERSDRERDMGIALARIGRGVQGPVGARFSRLAVPRLDAALRDWPGDADARDARATALALLDRPAEALEDEEAVLAIEPGRERALELAMTLAARLHRRDRALDLGRRLLDLDPWVARYHRSMAQVLIGPRDGQSEPGDRRLAMDACRDALRLDPTDLDARRLLIVGAAMAGDLPLAREEFQTFLGLGAPDAEALRRWLEGRLGTLPSGR